MARVSADADRDGRHTCGKTPSELAAATLPSPLDSPESNKTGYQEEQGPRLGNRIDSHIIEPQKPGVVSGTEL